MILQLIGTVMVVSALWVGAVAFKFRRGAEKRERLSELAVHLAISSWFVFMPVLFPIAQPYAVHLTLLGGVTFIIAAFRVRRAMSSGMGG